MRASTILALTASSLVAAAPISETKQFDVTNFFFTCEEECHYRFNVTTVGNFSPIPAGFPPVQCAGLQDIKPGYYTDCGVVSETQAVQATIAENTNNLEIRYTYYQPNGEVYTYNGYTRVAVTEGGITPSQQPANFVLPVTSETVGKQ